MIIDLIARQYDPDKAGYNEYCSDIEHVNERIKAGDLDHNWERMVKAFPDVENWLFENAYSSKDTCDVFVEVQSEYELIIPLDYTTFEKVERRPFVVLVGEVASGLENRVSFLRGWLRQKDDNHTRAELARVQVELDLLKLATGAFAGDRFALAEFIEKFEVLEDSVLNPSFIKSVAWSLREHYMDEDSKNENN